ncbi:MAG TPA: hypothetical protein VHU88_14690 [Sporichthyaceae bacterium]|nr:hypothetical protein [Sporichthyaceae bacterium]
MAGTGLPACATRTTGLTGHRAVGARPAGSTRASGGAARRRGARCGIRPWGAGCAGAARSAHATGAQQESALTALPSGLTRSARRSGSTVSEQYRISTALSRRGACGAVADQRSQECDPGRRRCRAAVSRCGRGAGELSRGAKDARREHGDE